MVYILVDGAVTPDEGEQIGETDFLHDEVGQMFNGVDVEGLVADETGAVEAAHGDEGLLEVGHVLIVEHEGLAGVNFHLFQMQALTHQPVRSFSNLPPQLVQ